MTIRRCRKLLCLVKVVCVGRNEYYHILGRSIHIFRRDGYWANNYTDDWVQYKTREHAVMAALRSI